MGKKLLYVASTYSHIHHFHRPYLQEFAQRGWEVHVACGGQVMELPEAVRVFQVPFDKSISMVKNRKALAALRKLLRTEHYTMVSTHTGLASFFTRMALLGMRERPAVACMVHGYLFDEQTPLHKRLLLSCAERMTAPVTDLLMTMNDWDTRYAQAHQLGKQIVFIPGVGVDFERLRPGDRAEREQLRDRWGLTEEDFLFVYAAEFSKRKDQETLIRAMTALPPHIMLALPGDGLLRGQCMELARTLDVDGRVLFPGQVGDMSPWYAAADGAVSSSRSEGLPFNIMEAMYCGLPVAATAVKGHVDLLENEVSGLLFSYGDSQDCARQLARIAAEPGLREKLSRQARSRAEDYRLAQVLPQVISCYARLLPLGEKLAETEAR